MSKPNGVVLYVCDLYKMRYYTRRSAHAFQIPTYSEIKILQTYSSLTGSESDSKKENLQPSPIA